ncbi:MAG: porin [Planctomycetaceae bacterium]|nr:porin [Planctomycetaceae bacterium]
MAQAPPSYQPEPSYTPQPSFGKNPPPQAPTGPTDAGAAAPPAGAQPEEVAAPLGTPAASLDDFERRLIELHIEFEKMKQSAQPEGASSAGEAAPAKKPKSTRQLLGELRKDFEAFQEATREVKYPNVMVHGVFQADAGAFDQSLNNRATYGTIADGAEFRRARLSANGDVWQNMKYFFQMDFAFFGRPTFTDVWTEINELPYLGNMRFGQWKQPFSLEVVSSFRYTMFMERSVLFQAFTPFRRIGAGIYNHSADFDSTWALSVFRSGQDQYGDSISKSGGNGMSGRVTHLPFYDEPSAGRYYLHLGGSYFLNSPPNHLWRFRTIPEIFIGENAPGVVGTSGQAVPGALDGTPFFVDTGPLRTRLVNTFGTESLLVYGPLTWQSEAMCAIVNQVDNPTAGLWGFYTQVGYMLTGEHRPYDRTFAMIDRIKPFESFFRTEANGRICQGIGAWELCARLSHIDLDSLNIRGGKMTNFTFGVNWYLNPYAKIVFNYINSNPNVPRHGKSTCNIYAAMIQMDF